MNNKLDNKENLMKFSKDYQKYQNQNIKFNKLYNMLD